MNFTKTSLAGAVLSVGLMVPASALAATIIGGPGNERLRGTNTADYIDGNGGNDRIHGRAGDDRAIGGLGNDRVFGGRGNDVISGVQGNDWLHGGRGDDTISGDANAAGDLTSFDRIFGASGNDTLRGGDSMDRMYGGAGNDNSAGENGNDRMAGGTGNDTIFANRGQDVSNGGEGNDRLWALARGDVQPGPNGEVDQNGDTLNGGAGDDVIRTRDGEVDRITCGEGNDRALLDDVDVIVDAVGGNANGSCEIVVRKAPKQQDSKSEDKQQSPADERKQS